MRVPFRERNPAPIGIASIAVIVVAMVLALNLNSLPLIGGGTVYNAAFAEAAGLRSGEEVRIAGVKVGKVESVDLEGDHVRVDFRVDDGVRVGDLTRADIKIKTLLGSHYLSLDPRGRAKQSPDRQIPITRTSTPFEIVPAVSELSTTVGKIDHVQIAKSFDTLSSTFENSPDEIRASLRGLRRLSQTISSRDDQLHELVKRSKNVTGVLAGRDKEFVRLIQDGDRILQSVQARRAVIHQLLINTVTLSQQLNGLIADNQSQLRPMLNNLQRVNKILLDNQKNLDRTIELLAPFSRQFADVAGTGRWFDSYIQNLLPIPASIQDPPANGGHGQSGAGTSGGGSGGGSGGRNDQKSSNPLPFLP